MFSAVRSVTSKSGDDNNDDDDTPPPSTITAALSPVRARPADSSTAPTVISGDDNDNAAALAADLSSPQGVKNTPSHTLAGAETTAAPPSPLDADEVKAGDDDNNSAAAAAARWWW